MNYTGLTVSEQIMTLLLSLFLLVVARFVINRIAQYAERERQRRENGQVRIDQLLEQIAAEKQRWESRDHGN